MTEALKPYAEYLVTGSRNYRGHSPGTVFQARHDPAKQRGINRGDIKLLRVINPEVPPGFTYPDGWLPTVSPANQEAAEAASFMHEGG